MTANRRRGLPGGAGARAMRPPVRPASRSTRQTPCSANSDRTPPSRAFTIPGGRVTPAPPRRTPRYETASRDSDARRHARRHAGGGTKPPCHVQGHRPESRCEHGARASHAAGDLHADVRSHERHAAVQAEATMRHASRDVLGHDRSGNVCRERRLPGQGGPSVSAHRRSARPELDGRLRLLGVVPSRVRYERDVLAETRHTAGAGAAPRSVRTA